LGCKAFPLGHRRSAIEPDQRLVFAFAGLNEDRAGLVGVGNVVLPDDGAGEGVSLSAAPRLKQALPDVGIDTALIELGKALQGAAALARKVIPLFFQWRIAGLALFRDVRKIKHPDDGVRG
jgi:hypothetical protein